MGGFDSDRCVSLATMTWPDADSDGPTTQLFDPTDGESRLSWPTPRTVPRAASYSARSAGSPPPRAADAVVVSPFMPVQPDVSVKVGSTGARIWKSSAIFARAISAGDAPLANSVVAAASIWVRKISLSASNESENACSCPSTSESTSVHGLIVCGSYKNASAGGS